MLELSRCYRVATSLALAAGLFGAACGDDEEGQLTDRQVIGVLVTANQGEIDYSQLGVEKATQVEVKTFAQKMVTDHTAALESAQQVADTARLPAAPSDESKALESSVRAETTRLNAAEAGRAFDLTFMCAQIRLHKKVLATIDDDLEPAAKGAAVKEQVQATRPVVKQHLDEAQRIVDQLSQAPRVTVGGCSSYGGT